jgi:hypothetical protein
VPEAHRFAPHSWHEYHLFAVFCVVKNFHGRKEVTLLRCGRTSVVYPPMDLLPRCPASRLFAKDSELLSYSQMNYSVRHCDEYGHGQNPSILPLPDVHDHLSVGTLDLTVWKAGSVQIHEIAQKAAVALSSAVVSSPVFSLYRGCSD